MVVGLAVEVDMAALAALVGSHHSQGTVREESLAQVQETSQVVVGHMA